MNVRPTDRQPGVAPADPRPREGLSQQGKEVS
jgi:hypothetical protein